jgi:DNA-binding CsgD family transcriptional regulator
MHILGQSVAVDGWCGVTLDPATLLKSGGVHESGLSAAVVPRLLDLEYRDRDVNPFDDLARRPRPAATLYDATAGCPSKSQRYRDIFTPAGYEHELRLVLRDRGQGWGGLVLLRGKGMPPFSQAETDLLAGMSKPLATGIRRALLRAQVGQGRVQYEARLILLDQNYTVTTITPTALRTLGINDPTRLPQSVYAIAARAQDTSSASARILSADGTWITMYGWRVSTSQTAVTLESTSPDQISAIVLDAYGLSIREREVTELVLLGHSTNQIAKKLFLSPYTVQDHLKSVFEKTGVRSRQALMAELFFTKYWPHFGESISQPFSPGKHSSES